MNKHIVMLYSTEGDQLTVDNHLLISSLGIPHICIHIGNTIRSVFTMEAKTYIEAKFNIELIKEEDSIEGIPFEGNSMIVTPQSEDLLVVRKLMDFLDDDDFDIIKKEAFQSMPCVSIERFCLLLSKYMKIISKECDVYLSRLDVSFDYKSKEFVDSVCNKAGKIYNDMELAYTHIFNKNKSGQYGGASEEFHRLNNMN